MSEAWSLFARALNKGASTFADFFKIWFTTLLILTVIGAILSYFFGNSLMQIYIAGQAPEMLTPEMQSQLAGSVSKVGIWGFLFTIFGVIVTSGLSVNSLRYYDGKFKPSWAPFQFDWSATFAYLGWSIVLGFIALGIMIIPMIISNVFLVMAYNSGSNFMAFLAWLVMFAGVIIALWFIARLTNKIVGRALGDNVTFGQAWNKTKGLFGFYLALVIIIVVTAFLFQLLVSLIFGLLFGIFTSTTMLTIVGFFAALVFMGLSIFYYAVMFALMISIYRKFFGNSEA